MSGWLSMGWVLLTCLLAVAEMTRYLPVITKQRIFLFVLHFWL
jgi:hypothetical protein